MHLVSKSTPFTQQKERISDCRPIWISPLWYQTQVLLSIESFVCILGVSLGQVIFTSSRLLTHQAKFDLLLDRVGGGEGGGGREMQKIISISLLLLLSFLLPLLTPPVKIPFSPLISTAVKIKDGGYTFHKENTEPQLTKIAPAPQAVC